MRRFCTWVALSLVFVGGMVHAADFAPDSYLGSPDEQLAQAMADTVKDHGTLRLDLREWSFSRPLVVRPAQGEDNVCIKIVGKPLWRGITYTGKGTWLTIVDLKDSSLESIGVNVLDPNASAFEFQAQGSAGRSSLRHCYVQGGNVAYLWREVSSSAGSDNWRIEQCYSNDSKTGFKVSGPNSLSPWVFNGCAASGASIGFDLRDGGCGAWLEQCGGSDTDTVFWVNGGYTGRCTGAETERARIAFRIGGDGAAGFAQPTPYYFQATDLRDTKEAQIEVFKAGDFTADLQNLKGDCRLVRVKNLSSTVPLNLSVTGSKVRMVNAGTGVVKATGVLGFSPTPIKQ